MIFFGSKFCVQDELNQPNLRFYCSEDKSSYAGAVFVNQIRTRYIWNNPDALGYSSRPIYNAVNETIEWTESKGQIILQTQIYF